MRKILFWLKNILYFLLIVSLFVLFYKNQGVEVSFNYVLGVSKRDLSDLLALMFICGGLFGILVSFLIGMSSFWKGVKQKAEIKKLESYVEQLKKEKGTL